MGKPVQGENVFYVFVNLLSHKKNERPEYFVVPSHDVYAQFKQLESAKNHEKLTQSETEKVIEEINERKSGWKIMTDLGISIRAIRKIANENGLKIKYDRGKGEDFPFCFYIRKEEELNYKDKWDLMFR